MTGSSMAVRDCFGEKLPLLNLDRTRDALAAYVEHRWPVGRRKSVMREWDLSDDEARSVCTGRCSWATWDKIMTHKNGRWEVILPVIGALLDEPIEHHLIETRRTYVEHAARLGAIVGGFGSLSDRRSFVHPDAGGATDRRRGVVRDRAAERQG